MDGNFEMIVFNVGFGNAIWVQTPSGKSMMFDIGHSPEFSPLRWIYTKRTHVLNALLITHPHLDHFDDIGNLRLFNLHSFYRPCHLSEAEVVAGNMRNGVLPSPELFRQYFSLGSQFQPICTPGNRVANIGMWTWEDGVDFEIFQPMSLSHANLNNHSLVTFVTFNGVVIMVSGDCETAAWNELLQSPKFKSKVRDVKIMIAPHHGRDSSYSPDLMTCMNPEVCIITDGKAPATAVTSKYDYHCKAHMYKIRGEYQSGRKCVSTRRDGHILVSIASGNLNVGKYNLETV